ncbi:putative peroxiredoxin, OsmC-like protein [Gottschalkia acidurici 9a]|uniref:Peroxiredoxin, OsmC-like protein n=1 Tax=Gottschalkia acidurici (strain ATCC 7906 / DSM 604 / BCRC 14475 / CIP 104303 / KCTC 5404 / NCIMB 10678 / 9a) TaxID=1128398 RepID=K0B0K9_GOTA9|nr:OsmC family protein [Gottschalkia acidurici]AFS79069.1 putative peroxiredoxin, OsmC-like protein [Gottschalkia acidurici 9a]
MKCVATYKDGLTVQSISRDHNLIMDVSKEDRGMTPGEMLINALAGCKLLSFVSLSRFRNINFENLSIEISAEAEDKGFVGETKIPAKSVKSIHIIYKIKTTNTKEEIREYLKLVDELCAVGNALREDIEKTEEIVILD